MNSTKNLITFEKIKNDLNKIEFITEDNAKIYLTCDESIENKYRFKFGDVIQTPYGAGIPLGEYNNQLWFFVGYDGIVSSNTLMKANNNNAIDINITDINIPANSLLDFLYKFSNYKLILKRENRLEKQASMNIEEIRISSAIEIQRIFRGFNIRKKYSTCSLPKNERFLAGTYTVGNDPDMSKAIESYGKKSDTFALIGTSGLRSIAIACQLSDQQSIPKIVIVDNSILVYKFWAAFKEFTKQKTDKDDFLQSLSDFFDEKEAYLKNVEFSIGQGGVRIDNNKSTFLWNGVTYLENDPIIFLKNLINEYGYNFVKSTIQNTLLIMQDWTDPRVFARIKNILTYLEIKNIYVYASNIASCLSDDKNMQVLENIENIKPIFTIHTNVCLSHQIPEKVYLVENNNKKVVADTLFTHNRCVDSLDAETDSMQPEKPLLFKN